MQKSEKVYVVRNILICDNCGTEMKKGNKVIVTSPLTFEYSCPKCGAYITSIIDYPNIEYHKIEEE